MSYDELHPQLHDADLVRPYHLTPLQPPYPPWYKADSHCEFHARMPGHSIETCTTFKKVVQNLINTGILKFDEPSIAANPLPSHGGRGVNMIEEYNEAKRRKTDVSEIQSLLR
ncbi:hypothetical protein HRI_000763000 [Hibiscus trionum]|uniref:Uncharacterized protein n=1 Tax=Hibiscus trionum TaxID=183268 RepID=A0A9W7LN91_HIBTR|nr:hypothetical protein HRI_000763000 [Hibiscus trionum]